MSEKREVTVLYDAKNPVKLKWWEHIYYWLWREVWDRKDLHRRIMWFWQRRTRGFDNTELWNLYVPLSEHILPRLIAFRNNHHSCPGGLLPESYELKTTDDTWKLQFVIWNEILDKMIEAFKYLSTEECDEDGGKYSYNDEILEKMWIDEDGYLQSIHAANYSDYEEYMKVRKEAIEEGLKLFAEYFEHLWD